MKKHSFTRQELYNLIWSTPKTKILKKYSLTSEALKNICKDFEIPIPENGYWMKLKYNKPVRKILLPDKCENGDQINLINYINNHPSNSPFHRSLFEIQNDKKAPIKVPKKLYKPDILIKNTLDFFNHCDNNGWHYDFNKLYLPVRKNISNLKRALLIMDSFVKLLKYRGHSIEKDLNNYAKIYIKDVEIDFDLREKTKRIPGANRWETSTYLPTGKLVFFVGQYSKKKEYTDNNKTKIEDKLVEIIAYLEALAEKELAWKKEAEINRIKREKEEKVKLEIQRKEQEEKQKFDELILNSNQYDQAQKIRNYIEAVKNNAIENSNYNNELKEWVSWASKKTDEFDPL